MDYAPTAPCDNMDFFMPNDNIARTSTTAESFNTAELAPNLEGWNLPQQSPAAQPDWLPYFQEWDSAHPSAVPLQPLNPMAELEGELGYGHYPCDYTGCSKVLSRIDSMRRHFRTHTGRSLDLACLLCPEVKYFTRSDHLNEHIRKIHGDGGATVRTQPVFCFHGNCATNVASEDEPKALILSSNAELHKHIRKTHKETPFICPVVGCNRVGAKGWFRKQDRVLHQRKDHSFVAEASLRIMNEDVDRKMPEYLARLCQ